jgi:Fic family protein
MGREDVQQAIRKANADWLHWDEFRHRPQPPGVTEAQVWTLIKLSRSADRRLLPLKDVKGNAFGYSLPPRGMEALHAVDRLGGSLLTPDGGSSLEHMRDQIVVSSLMEEAIATSQIEGAATTRQVAKAMLRAKRRPRDRSEQMIVNSYNTIQLLRKEKEKPLSLDFLFEIQASMTRDTLDDPTGVGRLRRATDDVVIVDVRDNSVIYTPPPAEQLPDRLAALIEFANSKTSPEEFTHPLVKAAVLHFWLAYEHPFVDGNGRTARALFYWLMLKSGYWLFEYLTVSRVIVKSPGKYYRSFLFSEHDDEDLTYSLLFQLDATKRAIEDLRAYLQQKQAEQRLVAQSLRAVPDLNHRQRALLDNALKNPDELITFQSHQITNAVTYVTARADLLDLVQRGLLDEVAHGRQRAFLPPDDLSEMLARRRKRGAAKPE